MKLLQEWFVLHHSGHTNARRKSIANDIMKQPRSARAGLSTLLFRELVADALEHNGRESFRSGTI